QRGDPGVDQPTACRTVGWKDQRPAARIEDEAHSPAAHLAFDRLARTTADVEGLVGLDGHGGLLAVAQWKQADVAHGHLSGFVERRRPDGITKTGLAGFAGALRGHAGPEIDEAVALEHLERRLRVHLREH